MTESHRSKLSIAAFEFHDRIKSMEETIKMNPKIMRKVAYKASELKKMGLSQGDVSFERESHHSDQAYGRRLYA